MVLTKKMLADMLMKYINREIDLATLISWAEEMMKEADFESEDFELIRISLLASVSATCMNSAFHGTTAMTTSAGWGIT